MARYLRHFALVMILEDRGLTAAQMQSVIGTSERLIEEYRELYRELNVPEYARTLARLKGVVFRPTADSGSDKGERECAAGISYGKRGRS